MKVKVLTAKTFPVGADPIQKAAILTCGILACSKQHEEHHIAQAMHLTPDVCKGQKNGMIMQVSVECVGIAECFANAVGFNCLKELQQALKKKDKPFKVGTKKYKCSSYVNDFLSNFLDKLEKQYDCKGKGIDVGGT